MHGLPTAFPPNHWVPSPQAPAPRSQPSCFPLCLNLLFHLLFIFKFRAPQPFPLVEDRENLGSSLSFHVFFLGRKEKGIKKSIKSIKKFKGAAKSDFHSIFLPKSSAPAFFPFTDLLHVFPLFTALSCCLLFPPHALEPPSLTR